VAFGAWSGNRSLKLAGGRKDATMSSEAKRQLDAFEQVKSAVENASANYGNYEFLAEYVNGLGNQGQEEDLFRRLAFRSADLKLPEIYEAMNVGDKAVLRGWWHEKMRQEAYRHDDLRTRLTWRYFV
jgi:hypothetical protein